MGLTGRTYRCRIAGYTVEFASAYERAGGPWAAYLCEGNAAPEARFQVDESAARRDYAHAGDASQAEEAALCAAFYHWLPEHGAISLHASALRVNGAAYAFMGPSGTGKSTHAAQWRRAFGGDVTMINDDEPILRFQPEGIYACGTPWQGKGSLGENISAPLRALVALTQADENRAVRLPPNEALPCVLLQTLHPRTPDEAEALFALADRLLAAVPVYRLYCRADADAALVCRRAVMEGELPL